jgi:hypothetical protein
VFHDAHRTAKVSGDEQPAVCVLPVVGDDAVPLAEQIGQLTIREQRFSRVPRGFHGAREPGAGLSGTLGGGEQFGFDALDLGGLASAFHEQHAGALDGALVVEVRGTRQRAGDWRRRRGDCVPALGERDQRPSAALERDGAVQRCFGVVLLVLAVVQAEVADYRQQRIFSRAIRLMARHRCAPRLRPRFQPARSVSTPHLSQSEPVSPSGHSVPSRCSISWRSSSSVIGLRK